VSPSHSSVNFVCGVHIRFSSLEPTASLRSLLWAIILPQSVVAFSICAPYQIIDLDIAEARVYKQPAYKVVMSN